MESEFFFPPPPRRFSKMRSSIAWLFKIARKSVYLFVIRRVFIFRNFFSREYPRRGNRYFRGCGLVVEYVQCNVVIVLIYILIIIF